MMARSWFGKPRAGSNNAAKLGICFCKSLFQKQQALHGAQDEVEPGLAYGVRSGVRLWDATLEFEGMEETAAQIVAGVKGAAAKYRNQGKDLRTVGLLRFVL